MKLNSVEFYQSVRLWNNQEKKTVDLTVVTSIDLQDHLVELRLDGQSEIIVIPTANMRHGRFGVPSKPEEILSYGPPLSEEEKKEVFAELIKKTEKKQSLKKGSNKK